VKTVTRENPEISTQREQSQKTRRKRNFTFAEGTLPFSLSLSLQTSKRGERDLQLFTKTAEQVARFYNAGERKKKMFRRYFLF
jgi:hypothetical protein